MSSFRGKRFAILSGTTGVGLLTATIKIMLLKKTVAELSALSVTATTEYVSSIVAYEYAGSGYVRTAPANRAYAWDAVNLRAELTHDNVSFGAMGFDTVVPKTAVYIRDNGGADSANDIFGIVDLPAATPDGVNPYVLTVGSEGVLWI